MANTTGGDRLFITPWTTDYMLKLPAAIPAASTTFYSGQMIGRDASGNLVQADDTAKYELLGVLIDLVRTTVDPGDLVQTNGQLGDKMFLVSRPLTFTALITSAVAGDEGRKVFVKYNNEVSYSPGTNANYAGTVIFVKDSTHVEVLPPWSGQAVTAGGERGIYTRAATGTVTLTKWDVHKLILMPLTSSASTVLPAASSVSPGDSISFINTSANSSAPTLTAAGSDTINGAATYVQSTTQYALATLRSDGVSKWYVQVPGPSGTVGATTFSGNVATSSATLTVTDNVAASLAVGPNGATNPALSVDCSVGSAATGVNIVSRAAAAGVTVQAISSTGGEALALVGGASTTSTAGGAVTITGAAGGATTGAGGAVTITGGVGTAGNSAGGAAALVGGLGQGSAAGGAITITSGAAGATGVAGAVNIAVGGATAGNGSAVTITGGSGAGGTNSGGNVNLVPGAAVSTGTPGEVQANANSNWIYAQVALTATDASRPVFIATRPMRLKTVSFQHTTGSTSGTLQIEKLTGTTAAGSGTVLLTGTIDLSATTVANTTTNGTLIATVASLTFAAGDRVSIKIAGTMTNLVNGIVTLGFAPT